MANLHHTLSLQLLTLILPLSSPSQLQKQEDPIRIDPYIIDYRNGTVVTAANKTTVPPPNDSDVQSKDIEITYSGRPLRARVFLPARPDPSRRIPILVYFHGGAFCIGSPSSEQDSRFVARVVAKASVIALSLDYTLFPDGVVPAPYEDAWAFLKWVAAHRLAAHVPESDPWLARFGDVDRIFVGGDSAGGNIVHNMAIRAGQTGTVGLTGAFLAMPYFLGSSRVGREPDITTSCNFKIWAYVCPNCKAGVDDPVINPFGPGAPSLRDLGCERMMVYVAEVDELRERDVWYYEQVKKSGWPGRIELVEAKGERHVFHILTPDRPATAKLIQDLAKFLNA